MTSTGGGVQGGPRPGAPDEGDNCEAGEDTDDEGSDEDDALYRSGRQADALGVYRRTGEALADELGIDPGPALQAIELAVVERGLRA